MSLDQLRYFVVVAEEGHLTRAAQRLHISQPPLTRQIKSLEDELGVALFERTPKGMKLLPPARVLLARARTILAEIDATVRELRHIDDQESSCKSTAESSRSRST